MDRKLAEEYLTHLGFSKRPATNDIWEYIISIGESCYIVGSLQLDDKVIELNGCLESAAYIVLEQTFAKAKGYSYNVYRELVTAHDFTPYRTY